MNKLKDKFLQTQWWFTVIATVFSLWMVYAVFFQDPPSTVSSESLLPSSRCPGGGIDDVELSQNYNIDKFNIYYNDNKGCNIVSGAVAVDVGDELERTQNVYLGLGLPRLRGNVAVGLQRQNPTNGVQAYIREGNTGALAIDAARDDAQIAYFADLGLAEILIANTSPGLSDNARRRVAGAYARLAAEIPVDDDITTGQGPDVDGIYDAWLVARFGPELLEDTLEKCRQKCSWYKALDSSLKERKASPTKLLDKFVQGASSSPQVQQDIKNRLKMY